VASYYNPNGFSEETAKDFQRQGEGLMKEGSELANAVYSRPNGHNMIHVIKKEIHILLNSRFTKTGSWERQHQLVKRFLTNKGAHVSREQSVLESYNVFDTLRVCFILFVLVRKTE
jgi:hypothetical protein